MDQIVNKYKDKYVLVCGYDEVFSAAISYGYTKAIHVDELAAVYHLKFIQIKAFYIYISKSCSYGSAYVCYFNKYQIIICQIIPFSLQKDRVASFILDLETRLGKNIKELKQELHFSAIFIMHGVIYSDLTFQIFSDILGSTDGHICGPRRTLQDPQVTDFYMTNPDLVWPYNWPITRFGPKTFFTALEAIFKAYYGLVIEYVQQGKPEKPTFDFAELLLQSQAENQGIEISKFQMIGDNPDSDIDGANRREIWVSILVKTGIFTGEKPNIIGIQLL